MLYTAEQTGRFRPESTQFFSLLVPNRCCFFGLKHHCDFASSCFCIAVPRRQQAIQARSAHPQHRIHHTVHSRMPNQNFCLRCFGKWAQQDGGVAM